MLQTTTIQESTVKQSGSTLSRADFLKEDFELLIAQKGREVLFEKALRCPCKGKSSNHQSNCRNCGATGWIFVNPKVTRMVLQGIDVTTKHEGWSEEVRGLVRVTYSNGEEVSFMDRITALDGESVYTEVVHFKKQGSTIFAYAAYKVKQMIFAGLYQGVNMPLKPLVQGTDYTISGNAIILSNTYDTGGALDLSITLRYKHAPSFHIVETKRDSMQSFRVDEGVESSQQMPLHAYARRAHYVLDAPNLAGDRLLTNDYEEAVDAN